MALRLSAADAKRFGVLAAAKSRKPSAPKQPAPLWWSIAMNVQVTVVSEINNRDHWRVKARRAAGQKLMLEVAFGDVCGIPVDRKLLRDVATCGLTVTWVRVGRMGPRQEMDDDNLRSAFKALRDALAERLGVDDGDGRVKWKYEQRAGEPGVELRIEHGKEAA